MELTLAGFELDRRKVITLALIVLACVGLAFLYGQIDMPALHERAQRINGPLIFVLMTVLPLVGFPVSVTNAIAGVRFGLGLGMALVAVSIVLQLLASYALVKAAPRLFAHRLDSLRRRLPKAAHGPLTVFTLVVPGVPYFAKNYVLPLVGVPLGTFLLWGIPIHVAKSLVGVLFGDMSDHLTPARIAGFAAYAIGITVACAWSFRRLQAQMKNQRSTAGGRKRRA